MKKESNQKYRNLIKYCYEILKHSRHGQHLFLNICEEAEYFVDISNIAGREILLFDEHEELCISKSTSEEDEIFEKIRRIYDYYTNNPYEFEIIYCYLFISGKTDDGKKVFAPLFTVSVELTYDEKKGSFIISLASDELRLNTFALADLYPEKESALLSGTSGIQCPELPLTLDGVNQVLKKITDLHPAIKCNPIYTTNYSHTENDLEAGKFIIYNSAGVALTKKGNVYLINDLRALLDSENSFESSVLKRFTEKNYSSSDNNYELGKFSWKILLTPFAANSAQIKVIKELEKNQLLHVQGPPGTGKSQTIANLVCHLVANGLTVLVTSQKNKALEVVSEMLDKLKIKYLYMQLLQDDKETKRKIKEAINELLSEISSYNSKRLKDKMAYLEELLDKSNEKLSELHKEFIQAQNFEAYKVDGLNLTIGEVYSQYEKLKSFDLFEKNEFIPLSEKFSAKDTLFRYLTELEKIASDYDLLKKLAEGTIPKSLTEIEQFLKSLVEMKSKFEQEISTISPEEVNTLNKILPCFKFSVSGRFQELIPEIIKIKNRVHQYISYLSLINESENNFLGRIINILWRKPKSFVIREKLRPQLNSKFGKWLTIDSFTPENENEILVKIDKVLSTINALRIRTEIDELIDKINLSVKNDIILCPNTHCKQKFRIPLDKWEIKLRCPKCNKEFSFSCDELRNDVITFNQLKYQLFHSYENKNYNRFNEVFEKTMYLLTLFPAFLNTLNVEQSVKDYKQTIVKIRNMCLSDKSQFKFFLENLQKVIYVGVLRGIINKADKKFRSTELIAADIRQVNEDKCKFTRDFIDTAIKYNLREKLDKSSTRNDLSYFARILQRSKKRYATFEELKNDPNFDFKEVISTLPCWIMSIHDVARVFPLVAGLFDVVIVDESSQCAIPSAIPILYRGKKAIIVGDDQQLPNVEMQYVDDQFNQSLIRECKLYELPRSQSFDCKTNSLFDLCDVFADRHIFLNEHFRCYPEIIRFCNEKFYNGKLLLVKSSFGNNLGRILNLETIDGAYDDERLSVNKKEAETVIRKLKTLINNPKYQNLTFGIMSIFREQVEYIKALVYNPGTEFYIDPQTRQKYKLIIETADGFQGDERDVILYSFRFAPNSSPNILSFVSREMGYKRLNVAFSRARSQIFCFTSLPPQDFPRGILRDYLLYVQNPKSLDIEYQPWDSEFEKEVQSEIEKLGLRVYPQFKTCGFRIDLVVTDDKGKVLAVECDGWEFHYDEYGKLREEDIERQQILERAGWKVVRITSREFYRDRKKAIEPIFNFFKK